MSLSMLSMLCINSCANAGLAFVSALFSCGKVAEGYKVSTNRSVRAIKGRVRLEGRGTTAIRQAAPVTRIGLLIVVFIFESPWFDGLRCISRDGTLSRFMA